MPSPTALVVDRDHYHYVSMGRLDFVNGPARYGFPTLEAATRFAIAHKQRDPHRDITIDYPDGRRWDGKRWINARPRSLGT